jgi:sodium/hydrogen antiporter
MGVAVAVFAALVVVFVAVSRRLDRLYVTAAIVFVVAGVLLGMTVLHLGADHSLILHLAEFTLALLLFHDAALVQPRELRADSGFALRLLLIGLPLTILAGWLTCRLLFPGVGVWLALVLAAALAPTDAGLGAATVLNPVVPVRVRRILNVESGLNDGLATPVALFAIAGAAGSEHLGPAASVSQSLLEIGIGAAVGIVGGVLAARVLGWSQTDDWCEPELVSVAVLMVPVLAYSAGVALHGNGFIAAFVAGTSFAAAARWLPDRPQAFALTEGIAGLLGFAVWLLLGALFATHLRALLDWRILVYAVLSLTVLRMVPVALALIGSHTRLPTVAFIGWFGPRGLASVVFALLATEELKDNADLVLVVNTIAATVLISVVVHGISAEPLAERYGAWAARVRPSVETGDAVAPTGGRGSAVLRRQLPESRTM